MRKLPESRGKAQPPAVLPGPRGIAPSVELGLDGRTTPEPEARGDGPAVQNGELRPDAVAPPAPPRRPVVQPLAPGRYKVQFTASAELHEKLERLRALMRSRVPDGDLAVIIEEAVTEKLERLEAKRFARTSTPRKGLSETDTSPSSRHIPAAVRRAVRERDGNRCRYVDEHGRRCPERSRLEYHHRHPFGHGGDHTPQNILLMCRTHNQYLAEHDYGRQAMSRYRRPGDRVSEAVAIYSTRSTGIPALADRWGACRRASS